MWSDLVASLRLDLFLKLATAVVLGGAIGLEREFAGKPAGLRTNILICLGSAILMDLSIRVGLMEDGTRFGDPARIAAQVVSGIGFLGAGTILQARGAIVGLTTAATLWVVAAIGLTVGAGSYVEAIVTAVVVGAVLVGLRKVERRILNTRRHVSGTLRVKPGLAFEQFERIFRTLGVAVQSKAVYDHESDRTFELKLTGPAKQFDVVSARMMEHADVLSLQFD